MSDSDHKEEVEEEQPDHTNALTGLQALLAGDSSARASMQALVAQVLDFSNDGEGPSVASTFTSCGHAIHHTPRTLDVLGLEADDAGGLTPASLQLMEQTMSEHSCFVATSVGEDAVRGLFGVLGERNSDSGGWSVAMARDAEELRVKAPRTLVADGIAMVTLLVLESHAARWLGSHADASVRGPFSDIGLQLEAPLWRLLTTSSESVAVSCGLHDPLLPLLAAVAAVGRRIQGNTLVVLPHVEWGHEAGGGAGPEIATMWFTVAKCEQDRPDRPVNNIQEPHIGGLVARRQRTQRV